MITGIFPSLFTNGVGLVIDVTSFEAVSLYVVPRAVTEGCFQMILSVKPGAFIASTSTLRK